MRKLNKWTNAFLRFRRQVMSWVVRAWIQTRQGHYECPTFGAVLRITMTRLIPYIHTACCYCCPFFCFFFLPSFNVVQRKSRVANRWTRIQSYCVDFKPPAGSCRTMISSSDVIFVRALSSQSALRVTNRLWYRRFPYNMLLFLSIIYHVRMECFGQNVRCCHFNLRSSYCLERPRSQFLRVVKLGPVDHSGLEPEML